MSSVGRIDLMAKQVITPRNAAAKAAPQSSKHTGKALGESSGRKMALAAKSASKCASLLKGTSTIAKPTKKTMKPAASSTKTASSVSKSKSGSILIASASSTSISTVKRKLRSSQSASSQVQSATSRAVKSLSNRNASRIQPAVIPTKGKGKAKPTTAKIDPSKGKVALAKGKAPSIGKIAPKKGKGTPGKGKTTLGKVKGAAVKGMANSARGKTTAASLASKSMSNRTTPSSKTKTKAASSSSKSQSLKSKLGRTGSSSTKRSTDSDSDETLYFQEERKPHYYDEHWAGNEDETGSVCSGVLDEDFCLRCGETTLVAQSWLAVVLCDSCDGEYHLRCLGLDRVPEGLFNCPRCVAEREYVQSTSFDLPTGTFQLSQMKRNKHARILEENHDDDEAPTMVFTPARPLATAWNECVSKGVMVVSQILPYDVMRRMLHDPIQRTSHSGRRVDAWRGVLAEMGARLAGTGCHDVVDRAGRYDLKLPDFVVEALGLQTLLEPVLACLRTIMPTSPAPELRTHDVVLAPINSPAQNWHYDDNSRQRGPHRYFTILVHLNPIDAACGGTEIWVDKLDRGDLVRARPGDALVFPGNLMHRGLANAGSTHRLFYYAAFACHKDLNAGQM